MEEKKKTRKPKAPRKKAVPVEPRVENRIVHLNIHEQKFSENPVLSVDEDTLFKSSFGIKYEPTMTDPVPYNPCTDEFQFNLETEEPNLIRCFNEFQMNEQDVPTTMEPPKNYFELLKEFSGTDWPRKTRVLCWWCKHSFDDHPLGAPRKYIEDKKDTLGKFHVEGCFCSFPCVKSYMLDQRNFDMYLLSFMVKTISGVEDMYIEPAPSWKLLEAFGGRLDVNEFRKTNKKYNLLVSPLVPLEVYAEDINSERKLGVLQKLKKGNTSQSKKTGISSFIVET